MSLLAFLSFNTNPQVTITDKDSDSSTTFGFGGSTNQQGKSIPDEVINTFKNGVTTYDEVINKLGKPTTIQNMKGKKIATYMHQKGDVKVDPIKLIPVIGTLFGSVKNEQKSEMVVFIFDDKSILLQGEKGGATTVSAEDKGLVDKLNNMDIKVGK